MLGLLGSLAGLLAFACALLVRRERARAPREPALSRIRLDPVGNLLTLRVYDVRVDAAAPLDDMAMPFAASALISVAGHTAHVSALSGQISRDAYRDFERRLRDLGITEIIYERHRPWGGVQHVSRPV